MKITKTQKGITLLALIITIVVLLILAGVAINSIEDTNLIDQASVAGQKWDEAQGNESTTLGGYEAEIEAALSPNKWVQDGDLVKQIRKKDGAVLTTLVVGNFINGFEPQLDACGPENWIVLGAKNGQLLVVSQTPKFFAKVQDNRIYSQYAKEEYVVRARSLNVDDLVFEKEYSLASIHEYGISDTKLGQSILNDYTGDKWWNETVSGTTEENSSYHHVRPVYLGETYYVFRDENGANRTYGGECAISVDSNGKFHKLATHNRGFWIYVVVYFSGSAQITDAGLNS